MKKKTPEEGPVEIVTASIDFFREIVEEALRERKFQTPKPVKSYLANLLNQNVASTEIGPEGTLAEMLLKAAQAERQARLDLLRRLGDTSLYVSGFFGDSLRRKIIDIDYYAEMGGIAYKQLSDELNDEVMAPVYNEFALRFHSYVDVLTHISQNSLIQTNQDLLRLYERYVSTGSDLAREQLEKSGLLVHDGIKKASQ